MQDVTTPSGRGRERVSGDVVVHRGIRYAEADRFGAPRRIEPPPDPVEATAPHAMAPQLPSRLESVMGAPLPLAQDEDCLALAVTAPADAERGSLPVMVWLHGGAYVSGGGEWNLYDASMLVRRTGIVVVSINYRLGALGYLRAPGVSAGNHGLLDQITALEWVQDNIAEFGGDPGRVTVAGQSAGAQSIAAMLGIERTRPLFSRAILQSAPLGLGFHSIEKAERVGEMFLGHLDADVRRAAVADVLQAQGRTARELAGRAGLNSAPPFLPVGGVDPLPDDDRWRSNVVARARDVQVVLGCTEHEMRAFYGHHPVFSTVRAVPLVGPAAVSAVERLVQKRVFDDALFALADLLADAGADVFCYRVRKLHPDNPFGSCHCIELPLLFGDAASWRDAPMLRGLSVDEIEPLGRRTREYWGEFVRDGRIDSAPWHRHTPGMRDVFALP